MDHSPTDDPEYLDRAIARLLLRAAEDPRDLRRLLEKLAAALELTAARMPLLKEDDEFLVWRKDKRE